MLPVVTRELVESLLVSAKDEGFVESCWVEMSFENLDLFTAIAESSDRFPTKLTKEAFLRGAFLAWLLLYKQDEVNEMNENWGV